MHAAFVANPYRFEDRYFRAVSEVSLGSLVTSRRARIAAFVLAGLLIVIACCASLFGRRPGPVEPALLALVSAAVIVTALLSSYVLFLEFRSIRAVWLAVLATAYAFAAIIALPYLMVFPGVFSPSGLFGATAHSSLLLWLVWHASFPALVLVTVLVRRAGYMIEARAVGRTIALGLGISVAVAAAATFIAARHATDLPPLVDNGRFAPVVTFVILPALLLLGAAALWQLYAMSHLRKMLSLWLSFAVLCSMLDTLMGISADRYSYAWEIGKVFLMLSSSVVLTAFLSDIVLLRRRLGSTNDELQRSHATMAHFRALSESTRDIIMFMDRDSMEIIEANQAAVDAFGFAREELIGAQPLDHSGLGRPHRRIG